MNRAALQQCPISWRPRAVSFVAIIYTSISICVIHWGIERSIQQQKVWIYWKGKLNDCFIVFLQQGLGDLLGAGVGDAVGKAVVGLEVGWGAEGLVVGCSEWFGSIWVSFVRKLFFIQGFLYLNRINTYPVWGWCRRTLCWGLRWTRCGLWIGWADFRLA